MIVILPDPNEARDIVQLARLYLILYRVKVCFMQEIVLVNCNANISY